LILSSGQPERSYAASIPSAKESKASVSQDRFWVGENHLTWVVKAIMHGDPEKSGSFIFLYIIILYIQSSLPRNRQN